MKIQGLVEKISGSERRFLQSSALLAVGFAVARLLGLGFSLFLGQVLAVEQYGFIMSTLFLANLVGILTQPFAQHIWARTISIHHEDPQKLHVTYNSGLLLQFLLTGLTVSIAVPLMLVTNSLNVGALIIFGGITLFFSYNGIARGFESAWRLVAVFIASNLLQLIAILLLYFVFPSSSPSPLPAIAVYGLSYVLPVAVLVLQYPLPVKMDLGAARREDMTNLVKATLPIWISHGAFVFSSGFDVVLLGQFWGNAAVGAYTMARTLGLVFEVLPNSLGTLLMPRIAKIQTGRARLLMVSVGAMVSIQLVFAVAFLLLYEPVVRTLFGPEYLVPLTVIPLMVISSILWSVHGVLTNALIGANYALVETFNRLQVVGSYYLLGFLLVPQLSLVGIALTDIITATLALISLPLILRWRQRSLRGPQETMVGTSDL